MKRSLFVESTLSSCRQCIQETTFLLRGQQLSRNNTSIWFDAVDAWLHLSLDLGYGERLREYKLPAEISNLLSTLTECFEILLTLPTVSNFKGWIRKESRFALLYPVYEDGISFLRTFDAEILGRISCWCNFLKKLPFEMPDLEEPAWLDWLATEERLKTVHSSPILLESLNAIMKVWLKDFSVDLVPAHGEGSVAEGNLSNIDKYRHLGFDKKLEIVCCPNNHEKMRELFPLQPSRWERTSRLIFVPKTYKKLRTVCPEPATLQYFQQPVMRSLYRYIVRHKYLHDRIPITNQTVNRIGACLGSSTGAYCTVDLSAASDSVLWSNAKEIFRGTPLYPWMIATRSSSIHYEQKGLTVQVSKYAPMGSALCFPTECLIFAVACEFVGRSGLYSRENISHYSIYGDDIVCPSSWYSMLELVLSELGFIVNDEKSFTTGLFRESCGAEYYNGTLLPHIHYKIPNCHRKSANVLDPLVNLANRANEWGYRFLRSWSIDKIYEGGYTPLFSSNSQDAHTITSMEDTNFRAKSRMSANYQRVEYFTHGVVSRPIVTGEEDDDCIRLFEWLKDRPEKEILTTPYSVSCDLRKVRLTQRWQHPWPSVPPLREP